MVHHQSMPITQPTPTTFSNSDYHFAALIWFNCCPQNRVGAGNFGVGGGSEENGRCIFFGAGGLEMQVSPLLTIAH